MPAVGMTKIMSGQVSRIDTLNADVAGWHQSGSWLSSRPLMANVLASVAQYETEVRGERVRAGQEKVKEQGKRWGGSKPGVRKQVTDTQARLVFRMQEDGERIADIARALGLSRPTIYAILRRS